MVEPLRSVGRPLRLAKTGSAPTLLLICLLLSAPSFSFGRADFGGRGASTSLIRLEAKRALSLTQGDANGNANGLCPREEGSPGRFPYMCSLRMAGSREHRCSGTLVGNRWVVTAAHCIDPSFENSVGCYPLIYCGIDQIDTTSRSKTFHVEEAYIHNDWMGKTNMGSDIAMLKLDKKAHLEVPRLFRDGMVYGKDTKMVSPGWGLDKKVSQCGGQGYLPVYWKPQAQCPKKIETVPEDSWLCLCEAEESHKENLEGGPLVLADWPCDDLEKGLPSEDLIVGVTSADYKNDDPSDGRCGGKCSSYSSISYFRNWILKTMANKTPPTKCTLKPRCSPRDPDYPQGCEYSEDRAEAPVVRETETKAIASERGEPIVEMEEFVETEEAIVQEPAEPVQLKFDPPGTSFGCSPPDDAYINDCGEPGTVERTCIEKGCCWHLDFSAPKNPTCFYRISKEYEYCAVHLTRSKCGDNSISEDECKKRDCCYDSDSSSDIFCFYKNTKMDPAVCDVFPFSIRTSCMTDADQNKCEEKGCCWWPTSKDNKDTWCYNSKPPSSASMYKTFLDTTVVA